MRPVLCLVSDRHRLLLPTEERLVARLARAARAGVPLVQIREPDLDDASLARLVERAVAAVRGTGTRVLVNDRVDIALAAGAHGVHLRGDSVPASRVRACVPPGFLIGRSVHSAEEAARVAVAGGLDYLQFGTVFSTRSKPGHPGAGVASLRAAVAAARRLPVLGVGGISVQTAGQLRESGCAGVSGIGLFADGPEEDLDATVAALLAAWEG
jgi:thiamine-phosphate diphosphorylase